MPGAVTLLVGARPGATADGWARAFAPFLERHLARGGIGVVNRPGDGGLAAARTLAAANPDGRVIGAFGTPLLLARAVEQDQAALLERLSFIGAVAEEPVVLVGHPATVEDLAALRAMGDRVVLGTPAQGSAAQLAAIGFGRAMPVTLLSFPNAAAARQAVLAGNIPCAMLPAPDAIIALRDGRLAGLAIAEAQRSALLPEVPTFKERGIPLVAVGQRGFAVPAGTDPAILGVLAEALRAVVDDPEYGVEAQTQGYVARFIPRLQWEPMIRDMLAKLRTRWQAEPWLARRD